jgi:RNA polymerase sigma-54 factor
MTGIALKQTQKQALQLSQSLQQSLRILQMTNQELSNFIAQEAERNPFIKLDSINANFSYDPIEVIDKNYQAEKTLATHLQEQIEIIFTEQKDRFIAIYLTQLLDKDGYLREEHNTIANELKISFTTLNKIIQKLQQLDPTGIFAKDLEECLSLQLREQGLYNKHYKNILANLDLIATGQLEKLSKICKVSLEEIKNSLSVIRSLNPKPAHNFDTMQTPYAIAEILVEMKAGELEVKLNQEAFPNVVVESELFQRMIHNIHKTEELKFCKTNYNNAQQLRRACVQRAETILRVAKAVVEKQRAFFYQGIEHLLPLTQKDIAATVELHESTVSRVSKTILTTPLGSFNLKHFFSSKVGSTIFENDYSSAFIKQRIRQLIEAEGPKPLADNKIAEILKEEGIDISRRTVTKYREAMAIASSHQRKHQAAA